MMNDTMKGVDLTGQFGAPGASRNSVQIELSQPTVHLKLMLHILLHKLLWRFYLRIWFKTNNSIFVWGGG